MVRNLKSQLSLSFIVAQENPQSCSGWCDGIRQFSVATATARRRLQTFGEFDVSFELRNFLVKCNSALKKVGINH